ncbi:MAG TPA: phospholipid carrier-dependent glycosyltransferase [Rhodoferax sp.]|nr:phospholipid carrier-dependent glycosyltransferase [Rhodoferax sp.]
MTPPRSTIAVPWLWLVLVGAAALLYVLGLGSFYAPTNGDEMVYIHIARMTAESGHWLPLQSEIVDTRNTKPPLLFWQAIAAGNWGHNWSLLALRLPSIAYTFLTTALLAFFAHRISGQWRTACVAAVLYLLFFSTFRYGRVYLTSAPETFWLALPMLWMLWQQLRNTPPGVQQAPAAPHLGFVAYTLFGMAMGLGAAYKSFALVAPAAAALWCAILVNSMPLRWPVVIRTTLGVTWSTLMGLGIFALWFVLDPDPASVWQEFVVAENAGKMSGGQGYWHAALFGAYPMWTQLLAYPENGGLLFFAVLGFLLLGLPRAFKSQTYVQMAPAMRILLVWLVVWLVIFTIPSQRSARYVIPAMPALAIVMALLWDRIPRVWFWVTAAITVPALVMLARIAWVMGDMEIASRPWNAITLIAVCAGLAGAAVTFFYKSWTRTGALVACLSVYATFGLMVAPLEDARVQYSPQVQSAMRGARIAVPNGFTGQFERFHFVFPDSRLVPYDAEGRNTGALHPELPPGERLQYLLREFDAVVWLQENGADTAPTCVPACRVIGQRWHVKSRHKGGEITLDNLWQPQQWLFRREWLVVGAQKP